MIKFSKRLNEMISLFIWAFQLWAFRIDFYTEIQKILDKLFALNFCHFPLNEVFTSPLIEAFSELSSHANNFDSWYIPAFDVRVASRNVLISLSAVHVGKGEKSFIGPRRSVGTMWKVPFFSRKNVQKKLFHTSLYFNSCKIINFSAASTKRKGIQ